MLPSIGATPVQPPTRIESPASANPAPRPYDAQGRLSAAALEWIDAKALEPSRSADWASGLVSAGLFAYLNFRDGEAADGYFSQVRTGVANHQDAGPSLKALIHKLDRDGFLPHADVFLSPPYDDPSLRDVLAHAHLKGALREGLVDEHPLDGGASLKARLEALPPGRCMMLTIDNFHVIAVARDSEQLWVFDATLNPDHDIPRPKRDMEGDRLALWAAKKGEPHRFVDGAVGGKYAKCVSGGAAESLLAAYLDEVRTQPVLISPPLLASESLPNA